MAEDGVYCTIRTRPRPRLRLGLFTLLTNLRSIFAGWRKAVAVYDETSGSRCLGSGGILKISNIITNIVIFDSEWPSTGEIRGATSTRRSNGERSSKRRPNLK